MHKLLPALLILSFLFPSLSLAQETLAPPPDNGIWVSHFTLNTNPPLLIAATPLDTEGSIAFSALPYDETLATDTLDVADALLFGFLDLTYAPDNNRAVVGTPSTVTHYPNQYYTYAILLIVT